VVKHLLPLGDCGAMLSHLYQFPGGPREAARGSSKSNRTVGKGVCKTWGQHNGDPTYGRVSGINKLMSFSCQMRQVINVETRQQAAMIKVAMLSFMYCPVLPQQCAGVR
jgi:hypothetical protein